MATLAHALQMVGSFIAPLIIFLVRRDSRFVSFHALQALLLQVFFIVTWIVVFTVFFVGMFLSMPMDGKHSNQPPMFIFFFPVLWLVIFGGQMTVLVMAIVYAIKAGKGEWANYPLIGRLVRKMLGT
ncbi:MAG: DUF4870 domain-containing protein [Acidobacteriales bacterium]|nr:DUF4870 domain-containing protein [Terriglobales bacterium]